MKVGLIQEDGSVKTLTFSEIRKYIREGGYMRLAILGLMDCKNKYPNMYSVLKKPPPNN